MAGLVERLRFVGNRSGSATGATLIEVVLAVVLVAVLTVGTAQLVLQGMQAWLAADIRADLGDQGRLAVERMAREIRMIRSRTATDITACGGGTLSFVDFQNNAISYTVGGGTLFRNGTALASAPTLTLAFSCLRQDGVTPFSTADEIWIIQIDLTVQNGQEAQTFRVRSHPRNFI